ncbi:MAG: hypothetical protein AAB368_07775, partial [bacterium]
MPKINCTKPRGGVKTCTIKTGPDKGRQFRAHTEATAGTRQKRKALAARVKAKDGGPGFRQFRFTKADATACGGRRGREARGNCMWGRVEKRVG